MGKYYFIFLFVGISLTLLLRIKVESTTYTSPDSHIYLRVADNLREGKGLIFPGAYPFDETTKEVYFAMWPAGYPVIIALVSHFTNTSGLVASKLINIFFLGLIFYLLWVWKKDYAWFPALYFCSFGMLEVFSYTWTEGPFLFFILLLCNLISNALKREFNHFLFLKLGICLTILFLLRYAGLVYFFFAALVLVYFLVEREKVLTMHFFLALLLSGIVVLTYFFVNFQETAYYTGGNRFTNDITLSEFILLFLQGLLNEFFIIRNYYFTGYTDYLFLFFLLVELALLFFLFFKRHQFKKIFADWRNPSAVVFSTGIFYLPMIVLLSYLLYFDKFNYRILAPFSMPVFVGLLLAFTNKENRSYFKAVSPFVAGFMILSLLMNLPKQFILEYIFNF